METEKWIYCNICETDLPPKHPCRCKPEAKIGKQCAQMFTEEDIDNCWQHYKTYLINILNGEYKLDEAREDLRGLIGSKYDKRFSSLICRAENRV